MMTARSCHGWAYIAAVATLATGCADRSGPEPLRISGWVSSPAEDDIMRSVINGFREEHPTVPVEYHPIQANYIEKIQMMIGTDTAPDVFMLDAFWAPALIGYDTLLPLDEFVERDPGFGIDDFEPSLLSAFQADGKTFGLPKDYSTLLLFYNSRLLREAGFDRPPSNWTELADMASKLTVDKNGDGRIDHVGFGLSDGLEYVLPFLWQNGAEFLSEDGVVNVDDRRLREALEYLQDLRRKGAARLPSELGASWNMEAFGRGRVAMTMSGLWAQSFMDSTFPSIEYEVAPLPVGKAEATIAYVVGYVIPRKARHPQRAWQLLRYLTSKEGQEGWMRAGIGLPPRRSLAASLVDAPVKSAFLRSAGRSRTWQLGRNQRVLDEAQTALQSIFITDSDVCDALNKLARRLKIVKQCGERDE